MKNIKQDSTFEQAANWYYRLREPDVSPELIIKWQAWLYADESHIKAFGEIEELMHITGKVEDLEWPDNAALLEDDYDGELSVVEWQAQKKAQLLTKQTPSDGAAWLSWFYLKSLIRPVAIPLFLAVIGLLTWFQVVQIGDGNITVSVYETDAGQHKEIKLSDGSRIVLGAKSLLSVAYTEQQRKLILERGAAYFDVAKDRQRPFVVSSGNRIITALGTEFNVIRQSERVVVTVTEGRVRVTQKPAHSQSVNSRLVRNQISDDDSKEAVLIAGQQVRYDEQTMKIVSDANTAVVTAWRDGNLQYLTENLKFVVDDINRYSSTTIRVEGAKVGELSYSGTVFTDRVDNWLESLPLVFPVKVLRNNEGIVTIVADPERMEIQKK
ncbi:FecR domain-containing protein [Paraglaciecola sp.]|uniref:FecR family protein n=1 Tax=Paraglaciecola sp. TaxID=1920173 RepID=UPI0030F43E02